MRITEVHISPRNDDRLRAYVTVTLDGCLVVRGLRVIDTPRRRFVAMPARRAPDGRLRDIAHPIHAEARKWIEERVLAEYDAVCREAVPMRQPARRPQPQTVPDEGDS